MDHITKPSITRLARRAGIKSISDECYNSIRTITEDYLTDIIQASIIVNSEHNTKTLMQDDVYEALRLCGHNVAQSSELGTSTCSK